MRAHDSDQGYPVRLASEGFSGRGTGVGARAEGGLVGQTGCRGTCRCHGTAAGRWQRRTAAVIDEERSPVHDVVSAGGTPLPGDLRTDMEGRFGTDFGDVRVHNDGAAHDSAKSVNAQAYTVGSNIVFQRDKYDLAEAGKHMIAHELTHVVQQRNGPVDGSDAGGGVKISDPSDRFEQAAVSNADRLMSTPASPLRRRPTTSNASSTTTRVIVGPASRRAGGGGRGGVGANFVQRIEDESEESP